MRFDHRVSIDLTLEDSAQYSLHELKNKISKMSYTGGSTVTQLALKEVKEKIFKGLLETVYPGHASLWLMERRTEDVTKLYSHPMNWG